MSHRSRHGGRHELGQNFLAHRPTIDRIVSLVAATTGPILEIGPGDGALTRPLSRLGRDLLAVELDEHRAANLRRRRLPGVDVVQGDALRQPIDRPVVVGNLPYGQTTPMLRHLLASRSWTSAVVVTQWEVARKRAGVGGSTMMTAQAAPWWSFALHGRVPARGFSPVPSVDGGILAITRRHDPLLDEANRRQYEAFVRRVFTGPGRGLAAVVGHAAGVRRPVAERALRDAGVRSGALPRDLTPEQWTVLFSAVGRR